MRYELGQESEDSLPRRFRRRSLVADTARKQRPLSVSSQEARGLSLSDGADPQEKSRVYSDSGGDHEAYASLWSAPGPSQVYRELPLPAYSVY
jgi:hypothetical protein